MSYTFDLHATHVQTVGKLDLTVIKDLLNIEFPNDEVLVYPGMIKHANRRHPGDLDNYGHLIPEMIANPDYIGKNPSENNSIELYKVVEDHLILAIKLDPSGYIYLSTFFVLQTVIQTLCFYSI